MSSIADIGEDHSLKLIKSSRKNSVDFGSAKGPRKSSLPSIQPLGYNKSRRNSDSAIDAMPQIKVTGTLRKKSM